MLDGYACTTCATKYAWPDKLAVIYSDRYRSAFVLAFLLAAFAVGMALFPVGARLGPHHWAETTCIALELTAREFATRRCPRQTAPAPSR